MLCCVVCSHRTLILLSFRVKSCFSIISRIIVIVINLAGYFHYITLAIFRLLFPLCRVVSFAVSFLVVIVSVF